MHITRFYLKSDLSHEIQLLKVIVMNYPFLYNIIGCKIWLYRSISDFL